MFDSTETVCVLAGVAAIGALYASQSHIRPHTIGRGGATECSARRATVAPAISARAASVEVQQSSNAEKPTDAPDLWQEAFPSPSEDFEQHFPKHRRPGGGAYTEATKRARKEVAAQLNLETHHAKNRGSTVLIPGREVSKTEAPKVSGGCFLYMTPAYADRLMDQEAAVGGVSA